MARDTERRFVRITLALAVIAGALVGIENSARSQDRESVV